MSEGLYICEVCGGTFIGSPVLVELDGYKAQVCPRCSRKLLKRSKEEKKVVIRDTRAEAPLRGEPPRKPPKGVPTPPPKRRVSLEEIDYVDNYGKKIREAREALGLTIEQVAASINIKASLLRNIEAERIVPPYEVARNLEKLLDIEIIQRNPARSTSAIPETSPTQALPTKGITLGEIVEVKKKRRKK